MKRLFPKLLGGAIAVITSACSLITPLDGLTDDSSSGGIDGQDAGGHVGSTLDGAPNTDATKPVTYDDAGNPIDTGTVGDPPGDDDATSPIDSSGGSINPDAGNANDATTVTDTGTVVTAFCAGLSPKPLFCNDFDEGSATTGWTTVTGSGGTCTLSTTQSVSAPASMLVSTGSVGANGTIDSAEYKEFASLAAKAQTLTLGFDVRFDTVDSTKHDAIFAAIHFDAANNASYEVQLDAVLTANGDILLDVPELGTPSSGTETYVDHFVTNHIATQQWVHMVLAATVPSGSGAGKAVLWVNGAQVLSTSINVTVSAWTPSIIMGITYVAPPANAWGIHYDNVTLDSK